jgi:hypothetical protein
VRELIYLSEAKLAQFRQEPRKWPRLRVREIGVPGVGQVGIEAAADSHLDDVIEHLEEIAKWYGADGLVPGEWVQFEASLNYSVQELKNLPPVVFFFADELGERQLIMHGSPEHVVDATQQREGRLVHRRMSPSPALRALLASVGGGQPSERQLVDLLARIKGTFAPEFAVPMTGYARVTMVAPEIVVASPLFVAYAR